MKSVTDKKICLDVGHLVQNFHLPNGKLVRAVNDVSFQLFHGETLGIVGESGSGKSMTIKSLQRVVPHPGVIERGSVLLDGIDLMKLSEKEMQTLRGKAMSMIFQEPMTSLNPSFRVGWQIEEVYKLHGKFTKKERREKAVEMLQRVHIPDPEVRINDYPHQFSGGMRQRVLIAIALACNPKILFADEPTTALDVTVQADIMDLLEALKEEFKISVVLVSHNLNLVGERSQRIAVMYCGRIVEIAPTSEIRDNPMHPYTIGLLNSLPDIQADNQKLTAIPGELPDLTMDIQGCMFRTRCTYATACCAEELPDLKEVSSGHFCRCHNTVKQNEGV